jgi:DNA replication initiation complex subunit (GINS family)
VEQARHEIEQIEEFFYKGVEAGISDLKVTKEDYANVDVASGNSKRKKKSAGKKKR